MRNETANKYIFIALIILSAYLSSFVILGEQSPILVHDVHDSLQVRNEIIVNGGQVFGSTDEDIKPITESISEINPVSLVSPNLWLYYFFSPFTAYAFSIAIVHVVAFFGMYLLLSRHILSESKDEIINIGVALTFSLLPFFPLNGLRIAGLPLALYAFLNIRNKDSSKKEWLIISLIPFYAPYTHSFLFFLAFVGILWMVDLITKKDFNPRFFYSLLLMNTIFLIRNSNLIYNIFFDHNYTSQRVEFSNKFVNIDLSAGISEFLVKSGYNFIYGQYHANSVHHLGIGLALLISLFIILMKTNSKYKSNWSFISYMALISTISFPIIAMFTNTIILAMWGTIICIFGVILLKIFISLLSRVVDRRIEEILEILRKQFRDSEYNLLLGFVSICLLISAFYGLWNSHLLDLIKSYSTVLTIFNFSRFNALHPLLWYMIFALSLKIIYGNLKYGKTIVLLLLLVQAGYLFTLSDEGDTYQVAGLGAIRSDQLTYQEYYSEELFNGISTYIGKPQESYRVVSIGFHPSVSQHNGFYTVDFYKSNYPLEYKHKFRAIIEKELGKNEANRDCFDNWGGRCYIFANETEGDFMVTKDKSTAIENLQLNTTAFKEMGGEYIFSAVEIKNHQENDLKYLKVFESTSSPWKIWLYQVA
ncbi:DUF6044 family protein [Methanococcoides methylutens]|uniref:DUF6044 family protein n=1 Tax=Methanococcoides methylutens TaxID=2226 RepID=UPI0006938CBF|nr:DUF6044 family protein [Methanococcoides methylutens]